MSANSEEYVPPIFPVEEEKKDDLESVDDSFSEADDSSSTEYEQVGGGVTEVSIGVFMGKYGNLLLGVFENGFNWRSKLAATPGITSFNAVLPPLKFENFVVFDKPFNQGGNPVQLKSLQDMRSYPIFNKYMYTPPVFWINFFMTQAAMLQRPYNKFVNSLASNGSINPDADITKLPSEIQKYLFLVEISVRLYVVCFTNIFSKTKMEANNQKTVLYDKYISSDTKDAGKSPLELLEDLYYSQAIIAKGFFGSTGKVANLLEIQEIMTFAGLNFLNEYYMFYFNNLYFFSTCNIFLSTLINKFGGTTEGCPTILKQIDYFVKNGTISNKQKIKSSEIAELLNYFVNANYDTLNDCFKGKPEYGFEKVDATECDKLKKEVDKFFTADQIQNAKDTNTKLPITDDQLDALVKINKLWTPDFIRACISRKGRIWGQLWPQIYQLQRDQNQPVGGGGGGGGGGGPGTPPPPAATATPLTPKEEFILKAFQTADIFEITNDFITANLTGKDVTTLTGTEKITLKDVDDVINKFSFIYKKITGEVLKSKNDFTRVNTAKDGWCFYYSVQVAADPTNDPNAKYEEVKKGTEAFVKTIQTALQGLQTTDKTRYDLYSSLYSIDAVQGAATFDDYIKNMAQPPPHLWAPVQSGVGEEAAKIVKKKINIFKEKDADNYVRFTEIIPPGNPTEEINILYIDDNHYDVLLPKKAAQTPPPPPKGGELTPELIQQAGAARDAAYKAANTLVNKLNKELADQVTPTTTSGGDENRVLSAEDQEAIKYINEEKNKIKGASSVQDNTQVPKETQNAFYALRRIGEKTSEILNRYKTKFTTEEQAKTQTASSASASADVIADGRVKTAFQQSIAALEPLEEATKGLETVIEEITKALPPSSSSFAGKGRRESRKARRLMNRITRRNNRKA